MASAPSAEQTRDPALLLTVHCTLGMVIWHMGDNRTALAHLLKARAQYDERVHPRLAAVYGHDFGVATLVFTDSAQLFLGHPAESEQAGNEALALALARRLNHPVILCSALGLQVTNMFERRDPDAVLKLADECIALAGDLGFPHWLGMAAVYRGWALAQLGAIDDGLEQIRHGIAVWRSTGAVIALGAMLAALAETLLARGQVQEALATTDEALHWIETNAEHQWDCLVRCCRGDVFCALGDAERGHAEYEVGLSVARQQSERWWELRIATHLARLLQRQDKFDAGQNLLGPVYTSFTSGFELRDLTEARTLLDELR
jgi:predicted ATPase